MSISLLFLFLAIAAFVAIWAHHATLSRYAVALARQHLEAQNLQFLDQSAVLSRFRPVRDRRSGWCWQRQYRFEFSAQGDRRYSGWITLNGRRLAGIELQPFRETNNSEPLSHDSTLH